VRGHLTEPDNGVSHNREQGVEHQGNDCGPPPKTEDGAEDREKSKGWDGDGHARGGDGDRSADGLIPHQQADTDTDNQSDDEGNCYDRDVFGDQSEDVIPAPIQKNDEGVETEFGHAAAFLSSLRWVRHPDRTQDRVLMSLRQ